MVNPLPPGHHRPLSGVDPPDDIAATEQVQAAIEVLALIFHRG